MGKTPQQRELESLKLNCPIVQIRCSRRLEIISRRSASPNACGTRDDDPMAPGGGMASIDTGARHPTHRAPSERAASPRSREKPASTPRRDEGSHNGHADPSREVTRTPDVTAVYNKMVIMRTEMTQSANGTAQEIQNIKEELKSLTANVQKGIAAGETATVAATEAAEVSKTVAAMARDIKNRGTQQQTGGPMSYAAAAAHGALAASTYSTQNVRIASAPVQREIIVNIRNAQTIQSLRAMNPRAMKAHVDTAIAQSENEHVAKITTMSANQLKSGDLSIRTASNSEMQTLRQFTEDWVPRLGSGTSVRTHTY